MPFRFVVALSVLAAATAAPPARAEVYQDALRHYSFEIPVGWGRLTRGELQRLNGAVRHKWKGQKIRYETGFRPAANVLGQFPFMVVHWVPRSELGDGTPDEVFKTVVRDLGADLRVRDGRVGDLAATLDPGTRVVDAARNRVMFRIRIDYNREMIDCVGVGQIGPHGAALLLFYAREGEAGSVALLSEWVSESFRFTDDAPTAAEPTSGFGSAVVAAKEKVGGGLNLAVLVGVGVAAAIGLVGWMAIAMSGRREMPPADAPEWR